MRLIILALGSRGDVQPYVALGHGLQAAGHEVCIATHALFEPFVRGHGLGFSLVRANPKELLEGEAGRRASEGNANPVRTYLNFVHGMSKLIVEAGIDCLAACHSADAILHSPIGWYLAPHIAEKLQLPHMGAYIQPMHPTRAYPGFLSPSSRSLGGFLNRQTFLIDEVVFWWVARPAVNQFRKEHLDLPPIPVHTRYVRQWFRETPMIYGYSPHVVPRPADWNRYQRIEITGYWFLDTPQEWQPSRELARFLAAGPAPVYVGFGSMNTRKPQETTKLILQALSETGQRGILLTGWGGLRQTDVPDTVFVGEEIPHDWLFPRVAAVVHHGGAGTTAAGLRAGVPSVVVPFFIDQPFWAQRVADLGVGPAPIPRHRLSAERLGSAIRQAVGDGAMQRRAGELGVRIRAEDGVGQGVAAIERQLHVH